MHGHDDMVWVDGDGILFSINPGTSLTMVYELIIQISWK